MNVINSHPNRSSTDSALIGRLHNLSDHDSWQAFYVSYWKLIYHFATARGLNDADAREVVQDTLVSVARSLHNFQPNRAGGSFKSWLNCLTSRRVADHFRRRPVEFSRPLRLEQSGSSNLLDRLPDPAHPDVDGACEQEWRALVIEAAFEKLKRRVSPRHYQIFHHAVVLEQSPAQVAKTFRLNTAQVYLIKHRVQREFTRLLKSFRPPE